MKKCALLLLFCLLFFGCLSLLCHAEKGQDEFVPSLPEEYADIFIKDGALVLPDLPFFLSSVFSAFQNVLRENGAHLLVFLASILFCSLFTIFQKTISKNSEGPLRLSILLCAALLVFTAFSSLYQTAQKHLSDITRLLTAFIPAVTSAAVAGGGVASAALSSSAFALLLSFVGQFTAGVFLPLSKVSLALDFTAQFSSQKALSAFSSTVRRMILTLLGVVSAILSGVFSLQHIIASKADSAGLRAFRFAAGSAMPLVGSVFSESSKTLLSGVSLMRSTIGAVGVCVMLLSFLPTLILLLLARALFSFSAALSSSLENQAMEKLFEAGKTGVGFLTAAVGIVDLAVIISLAATMYTAL